MEIDDKDPQSEAFVVLKEIMSLRRERRELLSSLTPGFSVWKSRGPEGTVLGAHNYMPCHLKMPASVYPEMDRAREMEMEMGRGPALTLEQLERHVGVSAREMDRAMEMEMETARARARVREMEIGRVSALTHEQLERHVGVPALTEHEQLERYFDSILLDMHDLRYRMLDMANVVVKPHSAALSTYMADELVNSTSRLVEASGELYNTDDSRGQVYDDPGLFDDFYRKILQYPLDYENKLALAITKEEEEEHRKEVDKMRKQVWEDMAKFKRRQRKQGMEKYNKKETQKVMEKLLKEYPCLDQHQDEDQDQNQDQDQEKVKNLKVDPSTMEYLKKGMEICEKSFADVRDCWYTTWGSKSTKCGHFQDKTTLSPLHFTHTIQSSCGVIGSTLEIYSIKIVEINEEKLKWPLKLYGMVAARDTVDHNRNIVFSRSSLDHQELAKDGHLCLTGPSRAIVALDYVDFEVELKIKEGEEGKELITLSKRYDGTGTSLMFENRLCKAVLKLHQLSRAVQATIVGVCVVGEDWPFEYGCQVVCSLDADAHQAGCSLDATADEVVLLDCRGGPGGGSKNKEVRVGSDGYLHLSRNVVSVQSKGRLTVTIYSYCRPRPRSRDCVDRKWDIVFPAQKCQTVEEELSVRGVKVKVVVAWSLLVKEKLDLLVDCPAVET